MKSLSNVVAGLIFSTVSSALWAQDWNYGIGTGIGAMKVDGDSGFDTRILGPIAFDASLDTDEIKELMKTAFGIGGYANRGNLTITYAVAQLELDDDVKASLPAGAGDLDINFKTLAASLDVEYKFAQSGNHSYGIVAGLRYAKQEYDVDFSIDGTLTYSGEVDDNWTDFVFGFTHAVPLSDTVSWSSRIDIGTGDTEGTTHFNTGINWRFSNSFSARFYATVMDVDYENGNPGDADFFFYDATETQAGVTLLYNF